MKARNLTRRKGQGMTEYIILVGIIGLLMIAAVNRFAFSVDEAIQGSANAFILHHPASDYPPNHPVSLGYTSDGAEVFAVAREGADGSRFWEKRVGSASGPEYDRETHGPIRSRGGD